MRACVRVCGGERVGGRGEHEVRRSATDTRVDNVEATLRGDCAVRTTHLHQCDNKRNTLPLELDLYKVVAL